MAVRGGVQLRVGATSSNKNGSMSAFILSPREKALAKISNKNAQGRSFIRLRPQTLGSSQGFSRAIGWLC